MIKSLNLLPQDLLEKVGKLIKEGKEETALLLDDGTSRVYALLLYETLKLSMFHNNLNKCDLFLKEVIENDITNGDVIVK